VVVQMLLSSEIPVLVLQGGGALGAYQAGAYEALAEAGITPRWIAGISIGAINGAIIAGNKLENRVPRLKQFWRTISEGIAGQIPGGNWARTAFTELSAATVSAFGVPGFFTPRVPPAIFMPPGTHGATSIYSTEPLRTMLANLVDFDIINNGDIRYSAGAVEVTSGNFEYFDTSTQKIDVKHVMASSALPPGFPPIEIGGKHYWDGGIVSNTPLQYILEYTGKRQDMCVFQIDLFNARGHLPESLLDVAEREKEIRYSSRTRLNTDMVRHLQNLRMANQRLLRKLPAELAEDPDAKLLADWSCEAAVTIVHLIRRRRAYERHSMDYEFSRLSMEEHWAAGIRDVKRTLADPAWLNRVSRAEGVTVLDLTGDHQKQEKKGPEDERQ
jgi:NTE family protein